MNVDPIHLDKQILNIYYYFQISRQLSHIPGEAEYDSQNKK